MKKHPKLEKIILLGNIILLITTIPVIGILWLSKKYIDAVNYITEPYFSKDRY